MLAWWKTHMAICRRTHTPRETISCKPDPGLLGRHQAFAVGQVWLRSQVRGRLLLALSYHLLRPEGLHHWGEEEGAGPPDTAQRREEGGEGYAEEQGGVGGWCSGADGGAERAGVGREGWMRLVAGQGGGTGGAGQGSGAPGGVTGSSVTCPPLTRAICCRERERRRGGREQTPGKNGEKMKKKVLMWDLNLCSAFWF